MNKFVILTLIGTITGLATGVIGAGPEVLIVPAFVRADGWSNQ